MKQWTRILLLLSSMGIHAQTQNQYTITNGITKEMTGYDLKITTYYPKQFSIFIDDKPLEAGATVGIPDNKKEVSIRYEYTFSEGWIHRNGKKIVNLELSSEKKNYHLNFCWHNKWRIMAEGAKATSVIDLLKPAKKG